MNALSAAGPSGKPRARSYDTPGRVLFDLDQAPNVEFSEVIAAAGEIRPPLQDAGMSTLCKATAANAQVSRCRQIANQEPERFLLNMSRRLHIGKTFLDYLRNDRLSAITRLLPPARLRPMRTVREVVFEERVFSGRNVRGASTYSCAPAALLAPIIVRRTTISKTSAHLHC
jgi:DNA primase